MVVLVVQLVALIALPVVVVVHRPVAAPPVHVPVEKIAKNENRHEEEHSKFQIFTSK